MNVLEKTNPEIWTAFSEEDFVVTRSMVPFTSLFTYQALKQGIKEFKRHGGIVELSQDVAALYHLITITLIISKLVKQFLDGLPQSQKSTIDYDHLHPLSENMAFRVVQNSLKISDSIQLHNTENPFIVASPLNILTSSAAVPEDAQKDIILYALKGQKRFKDFIDDDRLLPKSLSSVWYPMKRFKLKTTNFMQKTKNALREKVIKLYEERELLGRFLIIQSSRQEVVPKLETTNGSYEMSVVPLSLCCNDGRLHIPTDKSTLMNVLTEVHHPVNHG